MDEGDYGYEHRRREDDCPQQLDYALSAHALLFSKWGSAQSSFVRSGVKLGC